MQNVCWLSGKEPSHKMLVWSSNLPSYSQNTRESFCSLLALKWTRSKQLMKTSPFPPPWLVSSPLAQPTESAPPAPHQSADTARPCPCTTTWWWALPTQRFTSTGTAPLPRRTSCIQMPKWSPCMATVNTATLCCPVAPRRWRGQVPSWTPCIFNIQQTAHVPTDPLGSDQLWEEKPSEQLAVTARAWDQPGNSRAHGKHRSPEVTRTLPNRKQNSFS